MKKKGDFMVNLLKALSNIAEIRLKESDTINAIWRTDRNINHTQVHNFSNSIKENKPELIRLLKSFKSDEYISGCINIAEKAGYIIHDRCESWEEISFGKDIANAAICVEYINGIWETYRANYWDPAEKQNKSMTSSKTIAKTPDLRNALERAEQYIRYIEQMKRRRTA